ncbi:MAG: ABC transporter permease [Actinomycetota bacterium]
MARQLRYENKMFWRNPAAAFFTFVFPLMFLVIFNLVFGGDTTDRYGLDREVSVSNFYVPAIAAFAVITACYTNIAIGLAFSRDEGQLKRLRGTPLPAWVYMTARVAHAVVVAIILVVIVVGFGRVFYDVTVPAGRIGVLLISLSVGAACFASLGIAATVMIPNPDAAPAVVNATILPLLFISDIFIPLERAPHWLTTFSDVFPIKHFSHALDHAYNYPRGTGLYADDLIVMGIWFVIGLVIAVRFFSWEPRVS